MNKISNHPGLKLAIFIQLLTLLFVSPGIQDFINPNNRHSPLLESPILTTYLFAAFFTFPIWPVVNFVGLVNSFFRSKDRLILFLIYLFGFLLSLLSFSVWLGGLEKFSPA